VAFQEGQIASRPRIPGGRGSLRPERSRTFPARSLRHSCPCSRRITKWGAFHLGQIRVESGRCAIRESRRTIPSAWPGTSSSTRAGRTCERVPLRPPAFGRIPASPAWAAFFSEREAAAPLASLRLCGVAFVANQPAAAIRSGQTSARNDHCCVIHLIDIPRGRTPSPRARAPLRPGRQAVVPSSSFPREASPHEPGASMAGPRQTQGGAGHQPLLPFDLRASETGW